jgi:chemotaxis protein CheD
VEVDDVLPGLFAADVMGLFNRAVLACATRPEEYVVKVAGGGNMFPAHLMPAACRVEGCTDKRRASCPSVGCKNVSAARGLLTGSGYSIASESVGGLGSRKVLFDLGTGDLWVKRGSAISASIQANA